MVALVDTLIMAGKIVGSETEESPLVSVIIPVYNRQETVIAAIRSVLSQTMPDFELIVVDDASSPAFVLPDELDRDQRTILLRMQENCGAGAARNVGAEKARGRWLAWLDSDDEWLPEKLEKQLDYVKRQDLEGRSAAIATGFEYRFHNGQKEQRVPVAASNRSVFFAGCWFCPGSTILVERAMFNSVGFYDRNMRRLEDIDWFARFALAGGRLEVVPEVLVTIRIGGLPDLAKVEAAGRYLEEKISSDPRVSQLEKRYLRAYLELVYAVISIKGQRRITRGLVHLLRSGLLFPRVGFHLRKFWL